LIAPCRPIQSPAVKHHTEIELKWALDAANHAALALHLENELGEGELLEQENRFLDSTDRRLRRQGLNIRLRREGGRVLMTCKRRVLSSDGASHHEEWEEWSDDGDLVKLGESLPAGLETRLNLPEPHRAALAGAALEDLGGFANQRLEFHSGDDLLCLDRTDFSVRVDYELEIETTDPARASAEWGRRLRDWGVGWSPQPVTKFARFLDLAMQAK